MEPATGPWPMSRRIDACVDHYEVLGIDATATFADRLTPSTRRMRSRRPRLLRSPRPSTERSGTPPGVFAVIVIVAAFVAVDVVVIDGCCCWKSGCMAKKVTVQVRPPSVEHSRDRDTATARTSGRASSAACTAAAGAS